MSYNEAEENTIEDGVQSEDGVLTPDGYAKTFIISKDSNSFFIKLLISDQAPPSKRDPDNFDFLIHLRCKSQGLDDDILSIIDRAAEIMNRHGERDPDGEIENYKVRINTDKVILGTNLFIRNEKKDNISYMAMASVLYRLLKTIIEELDILDEIREKGENNDKENDEPSYDYKD